MAIIGKAEPRSEGIVERVAELVGCEPAVIDAIIQTETNADAFDPSKRLIIRPEYHKIAQCPYLDETQRKKAARLVQPRLLSYSIDPVRAGSVAWQYVDKLAAEFGEEAAFWMTSFGSPQIMGFNFQMCKYESPSAMVRAFADGEDAQLLAMGAFLISAGIKEACRQRKWQVIARMYNGKNYAVNHYDAKLAFAYEHSAHAKKTDAFVFPEDDVLELGEHGAEVKTLQERLNELGYHTDTDGDFGLETRDAVRAAQFRLGVTVDGKVGPNTRKALAAASPKVPNAKPVIQIIKDSPNAQSGVAMTAIGAVSSTVAIASAVVPAPPPVPAIAMLPQITDVDAVIKTSETTVGILTKMLAIGVDKLLVALSIGGFIFGAIVIYKRIQAQRQRKIGG